MTRKLPPHQDYGERRLVEWIESVRGRPHAWGTADCIRLAEEAVAVIIGAPFSVEAPDYDTIGGARDALTWAVSTFGSVGDLFVDRGLVRVGSLAFALVGDIVIWEPGDERAVPMVGVVVGRHLALVDEADGVTLSPLTEVIHDPSATVYRVP